MAAPSRRRSHSQGARKIGIVGPSARPARFDGIDAGAADFAARPPVAILA
jgi:hypothetical protein